MRPPRVLSIAGTDPTGGAGLHADLKSIAANGGYGMGVVTALVAQNTRGVRAVHVPPAAFLRAQLDAVRDDVTIDAVKIGMLGSAALVDVVRAWLVDVRPPVVVLDPVMVATSGDRLLDADAESALRALLPLADVVTPNVPELAVLVGAAPARGWKELVGQARVLAARAGVLVLAKGGHLDGADVRDAVVAAEGARVVLTAPRVRTSTTHGTGCSLSSALATRYAATGDWPRALQEAQGWLSEAVRRGEELEVGGGRGPVHHLAGLWERGGLTTRPTPAQVEQEWWEAVAHVRDEIDALPFVRGLADGVLPEDAFRWYLAQDALYLREYARLLSRAAELAPSRAEQTLWARGAHTALVVELELHESRLGSDDVHPAAATTRAYLDHLAGCASRGYPELAAALLPCYWIYQDVGARLVPLAVPGHPYRDWLLTYGDEAFAASTREAVRLVTRLAASVDDDIRARMLDAFVRSARHEHAFFAAPLASVDAGHQGWSTVVG
ncbi:bifunctional hydroxymethylpyrimidine kinase/phosphomethylpyrimidine kinase [Cellulomonas massiliensis]|uniref:bifunctional hydroxymethylpyrimidine kinase/phosphomethylpyrimidine kinase n=1 Tax=Cellulomonas massiliensis TaxID=1465811 RepID=UPI001FEA6CD3|nr:bifunctional hydroxymethylpyrimidine kinase/phosphomethylpyrimidine kinase [Cellulomonas massiliensis]